MIPLKKLRKITSLPAGFRETYQHYLEKAENIESAYSRLISILENDKSTRIAKPTLEDFREKTYRYFLKILYVVTTDRFHSTQISIKEIWGDAAEYSVSEYLAANLVKSLS